MSHRTLATALLLAVVVVWGWTFVLVKDAVAIYGVVPFLAVRFLMATCCLAPWFIALPERRTFIVGFSLGLLIGFAFLLQTVGLSGGTASNAGLLTGLFVVFAPLFGRLLFGVRTTRRLWCSILVSIVGIILLTGAGVVLPAFGDLLLVGCAMVFGLHIALLEKHSPHHPTLPLAFAQMAGAATSLAVLWIWREVPRFPPEEVWPALLITSIFASAVAYGVQSYAQRHLSGATTSLLILLETVFAVGFGVWLMQDRFTGWQALGAVLLFGAAAIASLSPTRSTTTQAQHETR